MARALWLLLLYGHDYARCAHSGGANLPRSPDYPYGADLLPHRQAFCDERAVGIQRDNVGVPGQLAQHLAVILLVWRQHELHGSNHTICGGAFVALALGYGAAGFLVAGFSEAFSPLACAVLLVIWYRTRNRMVLAVVIGLVLGMVVVAIAPGNGIRAHLLPPRSDLLKALTRLLNNLSHFLATEVFSRTPALLLSFFIGYLCPLKTDINQPRRWIAVLIPMSLAAMALTVFVPLYLAGGLESRHYTFAAFILVLSLFTLGVLCAGSSRLSSLS